LPSTASPSTSEKRRSPRRGDLLFLLESNSAATTPRSSVLMKIPTPSKYNKSVSESLEKKNKEVEVSNSSKPTDTATPVAANDNVTNSDDDDEFAIVMDTTLLTERNTSQGVVVEIPIVKVSTSTSSKSDSPPKQPQTLAKDLRKNKSSSPKKLGKQDSKANTRFSKSTALEDSVDVDVDTDMSVSNHTALIGMSILSADADRAVANITAIDQSVISTNSGSSIGSGSSGSGSDSSKYDKYSTTSININVANKAKTKGTTLTSPTDESEDEFDFDGSLGASSNFPTSLAFHRTKKIAPKDNIATLNDHE